MNIKETQVKDCRIIVGDKAVIISLDTALTALHAIRELANLGHYRNIMSSDASFVRANIQELEAATEWGYGKDERND
jgi:hypothetical protein